MTTRKQLTFQDIEDAYSNDEWLGFGYLGGRKNAREAIITGEWDGSLDEIDDIDDVVLSIANSRKWTSKRFFQWANSKDGRFTADILFGSESPNWDLAEKYIR